MFFETVRLDRGFTTTWSKNTDYTHRLFYTTHSRRPEKLLIKDLEQITKKQIHNTSAIKNLIKWCAFEYTGFFQQRKRQLLVFVWSSLKNNTIPAQGKETKFQAGSPEVLPPFKVPEQNTWIVDNNVKRQWWNTWKLNQHFSPIVLGPNMQRTDSLSNPGARRKISLWLHCSDGKQSACQHEISSSERNSGTKPKPVRNNFTASKNLSNSRQESSLKIQGDSLSLNSHLLLSLFPIKS